MADTISIQIKGVEQTQKKLKQVIKDLRGAELYNAMLRATVVVQRAAKILAPVDTGRLRASIMPEVRKQQRTFMGVVGSNVVYAPWMELGTRPHFPPLQALALWASRHGTTAYRVAIAIATKGTAPRRFLQRAVEESQQKVIDILERAVSGIVNK